MAFSVKYSTRKERRQPCARPASSGTSERPWICGPGVPPASSTMVGAMSRASTISRTDAPALASGRVAEHERGADALLVGEAALGAEGVLAEEVAVVAQEQDERPVELAGALQRVEDHPDALVDRGHHRRAEANLLLGPGVDGAQDGLRLLAGAEAEGLGPRGLALHHVVGRQHVRAGRELAAAIEVGVPGGRLVAVVLAREIERAVGRLVGVRMHRLVGEEEAPRPLARLLDEGHRALVQEVGDVPGCPADWPSSFSSGSNRLPWPSKLTQRS